MRAFVLLAVSSAILSLAACEESEGGGPSGGPADGGTVELPGTGGTLFLDTSSNFAEPSLAVDARGGVHVAYRAVTGTGSQPIRYAYCAANCGEAASWKSVDAGEAGAGGGWPTLALDAQGRPRIAWYRADAALEQREYWFAQCDSGCTEPSGWSSGLAVQTQGFSPDRDGYFAADPQGGYALAWAGGGTHYARCDDRCTEASSWRTTQVLSEHFANLELAFAGPGRPRFAGESDDIVGYAECDSACDQGASWAGVLLFEVGSGSRLSLRTDGQGRARLAFFEGFVGGAEAERIVYAWCDAGCSTQEGWSSAGVPVPQPFGRQGVDLALDAQGRPWLAGGVGDSAGAGLIWCEGGCESNESTWTSGLLESAGEIEAAHPAPLEAGCSLSAWAELGRNPSLALSPSGLPRVAYEATHLQGGSCPVHEDLNLVRVAVLAAQ